MGLPVRRIRLRRGERRCLERLVNKRTTPQRVVERANIVLCSAEGRSGSAICREVGVSRPTFTQWLDRYEAGGVEELLEDRPRKITPDDEAERDRRPAVLVGKRRAQIPTSLICGRRGGRVPHQDEVPRGVRAGHGNQAMLPTVPLEDQFPWRLVLDRPVGYVPERQRPGRGVGLEAGLDAPRRVDGKVLGELERLSLPMILVPGAEPQPIGARLSMDSHSQRAPLEGGGGVCPVAVESHLLGHGSHFLFLILCRFHHVLELAGVRLEPNLLAGPVERSGQGRRVLWRQDDRQTWIGAERRGSLRQLPQAVPRDSRVRAYLLSVQKERRLRTDPSG